MLPFCAGLFQLCIVLGICFEDRFDWPRPLKSKRLSNPAVQAGAEGRAAQPAVSAERSALLERCTEIGPFSLEFEKLVHAHELRAHEDYNQDETYKRLMNEASPLLIFSCLRCSFAHCLVPFRCWLASRGWFSNWAPSFYSGAAWRRMVSGVSMAPH